MRTWTRPIARAVSPDTATGTDCRLPVEGTGKRVRGIGSVLSHTAVTGGRILQGSTYTRVMPSAVDHRLPWSHYLLRPGTVESVGRLSGRPLARGFFAADDAPDVLDLGGANRRCLREVQRSPCLDNRPPLKTARTRLRWAVVLDAENHHEQAEFTLTGRRTRTLLIRAASLDALDELVAFSEDIARHDWLLTVMDEVLSRLDECPIRSRRLRMAAEHLAHLWMPSPTPGPLAALFWSGFEQDPGFTRQWSAIESQVRRTIAARSFALLDEQRPDRPLASEIARGSPPPHRPAAPVGRFPLSPVCRRGGG
ncbi:SCO2521 family protein [Yinghuangia aomiensis]|uniref:SCO2521 family protein n=1 Tax=Yinghuangia aomiensis TaxID=676205 RepID=A0ABP9H4H9_9ACTN